jgi:hypothetical protein
MSNSFHTPLVVILQEAEHALEAMIWMCPEGGVRASANTCATAWANKARAFVETLPVSVTGAHIQHLLTAVREAGQTMQAIVDTCSINSVREQLIAAWKSWLTIASDSIEASIAAFQRGAV